MLLPPSPGRCSLRTHSGSLHRTPLTLTITSSKRQQPVSNFLQRHQSNVRSGHTVLQGAVGTGHGAMRIRCTEVAQGGWQCLPELLVPGQPRHQHGHGVCRVPAARLPPAACKHRAALLTKAVALLFSSVLCVGLAWLQRKQF